jgi:putative spermidine/putrescine transport system permease protein
MRMRQPSWASPLDRAWRWARWGICALVLLFLTAPILVILPLSFNSEPYFSYPIPGWSLRWYEHFFTSPAWQRALRNSLVVATATTAVATPLGTMAALGLTRPDFPLRGVVAALLISPMVVPSVITAVGLYFFYSRIGLSESLLGLVLAHTVLATPFVVIIVGATLAGFDVTLPRAAASLGARPLWTFLTVTLPLILPGIVSGAVFAFVTSFDEVVVVIFLAAVEQHTLTREMWKGIRENINPTILAVACLMAAISIVVLTSVELLRRRSARLRGADA